MLARFGARIEPRPGPLRAGVFCLGHAQLRRRGVETSFVPTEPAASLSPAARRFLEETTLRALLGIPARALDILAALGYQLYQAGRYAEVEILCRGLVAADHTAWWPYSLQAATLRRLGKLRAALDALALGLAQEPNQPKLLFMRSEIRAALDQGEKAPPETPSMTKAPPHIAPGEKEIP